MSALRRTMPAVLAILFALPALGGPDSVKIYRKELGRVRARQKFYEAKKLEEDLRAADEVFRAPWRERGGPDAPKVIDYDFSGFADVYERYADFEREMGELALALGLANDKAAAAALVDSLVEVLDSIQKLDREVADAKPLSRGVSDQGPGIRRYAAWIHRDRLVQALASLTDPAATAWLGEEGWAAAADADRKRKSDRARIAILDALSAANAARIGEQAGAESPRLRIAALEALARVAPGPETERRLRAALADDPCRAVRATAAALLGEKPPEPGEGTPRFFGIPVAGRRTLVLLDTGSYTIKPADVELAKERSFYEWRSLSEKDRYYLSQLGLMASETRDFLRALPAGARFDVLDLGDGDRITGLSPRGLLPADDASFRRASEFLGGLVAGGFVSPVEGLWEASRRAGVDPFGSDLPDDPEADAILLVTSGVPRGGPIMHGAAILDDLGRRHRFLRIPVVAVRLDDCAAPAEEVMKGIAEITGGAYSHRTAP